MNLSMVSRFSISSAKLIFIFLLFFSSLASAHELANVAEHKRSLAEYQRQHAHTLPTVKANDKFFRKLFMPNDNLFPPADDYRNADGMPGVNYWENRADYRIDVVLDQSKNSITGKVGITYHNNSPQPLPFLWLQLDQQSLQHDQSYSNGNILSNLEPVRKNDAAGEAVLNLDSFKVLLDKNKRGFNISSVKDDKDKSLSYSIQGTMMRIDLANELQPGQSLSFFIDYSYNVTDALLETAVPPRTGYEKFPDGNKAFYIMQFYPRMAYYDRTEGWDIRPYLGIGEFNLTFGDYEMFITVPDNHILTATGELQNPKKALPRRYYKRFVKAKSSTEPVVVVSKKDALLNAKTKPKGNKTWHYIAKNVRDVAFVSSSRFIWDSVQGNSGPNNKDKIQINSFYHTDADVLPSQVALAATQSTIDVYAKHTFDYPYPVINVVEGAKLGMEYPMVATYHFVQEADGTYSQASKSGALITIIHEVGHNFIPMVVSPNERKYAWMDEGMNTYLHNLTANKFSKFLAVDDIRVRELTAKMMKANDRRIVMDEPDNYGFARYFPNAYAIPALGMTVLRETILGREVFDKAFKGFFTAWKFKHPTPYDFFRYIEKSSGRELNWFWRGWFFSGGHVDLAIDRVRIFNIHSLDDKDKQAMLNKLVGLKDPIYTDSISTILDKNVKKVAELNPRLTDIYDDIKENRVNLEPFVEEQIKSHRAELGKENDKYLQAGKKFVQVALSNLGGIVMPVILRISYKDGSSIIRKYSVNIWRVGESTKTDVVIMIPKEKEVTKVALDPFYQTADANRINNYWAQDDMNSQEYIYLKKGQQHKGQKNFMQALQQAERQETDQ